MGFEWFATYRKNFIKITLYCLIAFIILPDIIFQIGFYLDRLSWALIQYVFGDINMFWPVVAIVFEWVCAILTLPHIYYGIYRVLIKIYSNENPTIGDLFSGFRKYKLNLKTGLIYSVLTFFTVIVLAVGQLAFMKYYEYQTILIWNAYPIFQNSTPIVQTLFFAFTIFMVPIMIRRKVSPMRSLRLSFLHYIKRPFFLTLLALLTLTLHWVSSPTIIGLVRFHFTSLSLLLFLYQFLLLPLVHSVIVVYFLKNVDSALSENFSEKAGDTPATDVSPSSI